MSKVKELKEVLEQIKSLAKNVESKIEALKLEKEGKFAELKEAHRNGAVIEFFYEPDNEWYKADIPYWDTAYKYRIKPEERPKVDDVCRFQDCNEKHYDVNKLAGLLIQTYTDAILNAVSTYTDVSKKLTKEDVYVIIDTPKKAKKLKKVLDMFKEKINEVDKIALDTGEYPSGAILRNQFNRVSFMGRSWYIYSEAPLDRTKVSIKELRNILAREHLKAGDYVVCEDDGNVAVGVFKEWEHRFGFEIENCCYLGDKYDYRGSSGCFNNFKRYATSEEIALLESQNNNTL